MLLIMFEFYGTTYKAVHQFVKYIKLSSEGFLVLHSSINPLILHFTVIFYYSVLKDFLFYIRFLVLYGDSLFYILCMHHDIKSNSSYVRTRVGCNNITFVGNGVV